MSPSLFALFINDLASELNTLCKGINIGYENLSILLFADDIVLVSDNELDMQVMLDYVNEWFSKWRLTVNNLKSKVMHFRKKSVPRSNFQFCLGQNNLNYVDEYKYLGIMFSEFFRFYMYIHISCRVCK